MEEWIRVTNCVSGALQLRTQTDNAERVNEMILTNHHIKFTETASELNISYGSVFVIIHDQLGYRKMCAHWVPRLLTDNPKINFLCLPFPFSNGIPGMVHNFWRES